MQPPSRSIASAASSGLIATLLVCAAATAQPEVQSELNSDSDQAPPIDAATSVSQETRAAAALDAGRVLREGSHLVQIRGSMPQSTDTGWWSLMIQSDHPSLAGLTLKILPNTKLSEMQRIVESMPDQAMIFEVTGEIFAFQNENYLLISHAPLVGLQPQDEVSNLAEESANAEKPESSDASDESPRSGGDSPQQILRELDEAVAPLGKSIDVAAAPGGSGLDALASTVLKENTTLLNRRGRLTRTGGGAWNFVFDADAEGNADPPMVVLPCLLLQRMESIARNADAPPPVLISGRVLAYRGRNFLLPTSFRVPGERTPLHP